MLEAELKLERQHRGTMELQIGSEKANGVELERLAEELRNNISILETANRVMKDREVAESFRDCQEDDLQARKRLMNDATFSQRSFFREVRNPLGGGGLGYAGQVNPSPVPGGTYVRHVAEAHGKQLLACLCFP